MINQNLKPKMKRTKLYFYFIIIPIIIFCYSCSSSSYKPFMKENHYKIFRNIGSYFIDYDIITARDYKENDFYILTKIQDDSSIIAKGYEKTHPDSVYKLEMEKIDSVIVLETYRGYNKIYQNEILIWYQDTVRVPLYSAKNIARSWNEVYIKKQK